MKSGQDRIEVKIYFNERFLIRRLGKAICGRFLNQWVDQVEVEGADIKVRGTYYRSQFKGGTDLVPPSLTLEVLSSGSYNRRTYYRPGNNEGGGRKGSIRRI